MTCWCCCCCFALLCSASIPIQRLLCIRSGVCKLLCCCSDFVWCILFFSLSVSIVFSPSIFLSSYNNGFLVCSIASTYFDRTLESICSAQNNNTQRATFLSKGKPISVPHGALHSCIMITRYQQHKFVQIYSPNVIAIYGMILLRFYAALSLFSGLFELKKKLQKLAYIFGPILNLNRLQTIFAIMFTSIWNWLFLPNDSLQWDFVGFVRMCVSQYAEQTNMFTLHLIIILGYFSSSSIYTNWTK